MTCCHPSMSNVMSGPLYDSALVVLGLIRKNGSRVIALSELCISRLVILA